MITDDDREARIWLARAKHFYEATADRDVTEAALIASAVAQIHATLDLAAAVHRVATAAEEATK